MELEAENWRLCSTTLVRGVGEYVGRWKMRTGEVVVQLLVRGVSGELEDFRFPRAPADGSHPKAASVGPYLSFRMAHMF